MTNFHDLFRQPTRPIDGAFPAARRSELFPEATGASRNSHTPVVGLWVDGMLVETASGYGGRQLVARVCDLDPVEVDARMKSVHSRR